jgi:hypothetical protein
LPDPNWSTVQIKKTTKEKLVRIYEEKKHELFDKGIRSFNGFFQDLVESVIAQDEYLKISAPGLEFKGSEGDEVWIYSAKEQRTYTLRIHNNTLTCDQDRSDSCIHVRFAWAIPELYKVLIEKRVKKP